MCEYSSKRFVMGHTGCLAVKAAILCGEQRKSLSKLISWEIFTAVENIRDFRLKRVERELGSLHNLVNGVEVITLLSIFWPINVGKEEKNPL